MPKNDPTDEVLDTIATAGDSFRSCIATLRVEIDRLRAGAWERPPSTAYELGFKSGAGRRDDLLRKIVELRERAQAAEDFRAGVMDVTFTAAREHLNDFADYGEEDVPRLIQRLGWTTAQLSARIDTLEADKRRLRDLLHQSRKHVPASLRESIDAAMEGQED